MYTVEEIQAVSEACKAHGLSLHMDGARFPNACASLGVEPEESVFLDDLGVNLKPARALGMHTIKVTDPDQALAELERVLEHPLVIR